MRTVNDYLVIDKLNDMISASKSSCSTLVFTADKYRTRIPQILSGLGYSYNHSSATEAQPDLTTFFNKLYNEANNGHFWCDALNVDPT